MNRNDVPNEDKSRTAQKCRPVHPAPTIVPSENRESTLFVPDRFCVLDRSDSSRAGRISSYFFCFVVFRFCFFFNNWCPTDIRTTNDKAKRVFPIIANGDD